MTLKNAIVIIGVLLIGVVISFLIMSVNTPKTKNNIVTEVISSSTPNIVVQEEKLEEVGEALRNPKELHVTGEVISVENTSIQVKLSPLLGYTTERNVLINVDSKTLFLSVLSKDSAIYEKEIREFVNNNNQGIQPKTYSEKEVSLNEVRVGDMIIVTSYDEISTTTTSFLAKTVSIHSNKKDLPDEFNDFFRRLPEIPKNSPETPDNIPNVPVIVTPSAAEEIE